MSASLRAMAAENGNRIGPDRDGAPIVRVDLQALRFHPRNIRTNLGDLRALTDSIRQEGVLVPLMAERLPSGGLRLLHGHRRWAAADMAGLKRVPVVIVPPHADDDAMLLMLAENTGRATVDAKDLQRSVRALRAEFGWSVKAIAARLGVDEATVTAWSAGRGLAASAARLGVATSSTERTRRKDAGQPKPAAPKLRPKAMHDLLTRRDAGELDDAAVVAAVREWMGDWRPAAPAARTPTSDCEPDFAAVEALASGRLRAQDVRPVDRRAAVRRMTERGSTAEQIADVTGMSQRSVVRLRDKAAGA